MNQLAKNKEDLILEASVSFKDKTVLVLENIGGHAFDGFKQTLRRRGVTLEAEVLVLFKDLTWFRGGEDAFLITDKHIYYHEWGYRCLVISDIDIVRIGGLFDENIEFVLKNGQVVSLWLSKIFYEVKTVIDLLQLEDKITPDEQKTVVHQVQCLGCRAIVRASQNFCEYCRSPLG